MLLPLISILITGCSLGDVVLIIGFETTTMLYETQFTFPAVAGIGPYNASLAHADVLIPSVAATYVSEIYLDVLHSAQLSTSLPPHSCSGDGCLSTFVVGPVGFIQPPPLQSTNYSRADTIFVHRLQGVQIEFWDADHGEQFMIKDCKTWGTNNSAIQVCIGVSSVDKHYLVAGIRPNCVL